MRSKMGRIAICVAGFAMLLLFQNFTYDKDSDPRDAIFGKGKLKNAIKAPWQAAGEGTGRRAVAMRSADENPELRGLALQASTYADFVGVEDVKRMSDAEILSRVSDSMFTSVEVMKMENTRDGKVKTVESIARALEKDSKLQRMVIATVRENANNLQ